MVVIKRAIFVSLYVSMMYQMLHSMDKYIDRDSLPADLMIMLDSAGRLNDEAFKKYEINYTEKNLHIYEIVEWDKSKFDKSLQVNLFNNFVVVDSFAHVVSFLYNLFPRSNIIVPEKYRETILKVVSIGYDITKSQALDEILNRYKLKLLKKSVHSNLLQLDFETIQLGVDSMMKNLNYNSLNYVKIDDKIYYKDVTSADLKYIYTFFTGKELVVECKIPNFALPYLVIDVSGNNTIEDQLRRIFRKSKYLKKKYDKLVLEEK